MAKVYLTYANGTTPIVKAREVKVAAPFDVRTVVDSYEDLYDNTVFERSELYLGMPVITLDTYDIYILTAIPGKKQTSADAWAANIGWKKIGSGSVDPSENLDYYKDELGTKVVESIDEIDEPYAGQTAIVSGSSNEGEDGLYVYTSNNEWLKVSGVDGQDGADGQNGQDGAPGADGQDGAPGLSAYELAIANMEGSDVPTEEEWLESLKGKDGRDGVDGLPGTDGKDGKDGQDGAPGLSAYELAVLNLEGSDVPTEEEWIASLKGADGKDGKDGADGLPGINGIDGKDGQDGKDGVDGKDGANGLSAYELVILNLEGSDVPSEEEWLESLKGRDGIDGIDGKDGADGKDGLDGLDGKDGAPGLSAYEIAIANMDGSDVPTEEEWLASLKGADGKDGKDGLDGQNGLSAYELAIADMEGSDVPTEEEWLESLQAVISPEDKAKIDALPTQGSFPADSELEDEPINGFATVQDVMEYVDALFEKKKEELTEPDYIFVNGTKRLNASTAPTNTIYQMNRFEITDDILTNGLEVVVPMEANGYYAEDSPVDTIYSEVFSIEVPAEYTVTVYGYDDESPTGWSTVEEPMVVNPKYATKEYAGKTYNCYSRRTLSGADDDYAPIGQYSPYSGAYSSITSYKIIINK